MFLQCNIFIPDLVKSCLHHLDERGHLLRPLLNGLKYINRPYILRGPLLTSLLRGIRTVSKEQERFHCVDNCNEDEVLTLTSLTKAQLRELLTYCDGVPCQDGLRRVKEKDLLAFLCKLLQGLSDEFLKFLFKYSSRQATSMAIAMVMRSFMQRFVQENIGLEAITREEYIRQHVIEFANHLHVQSGA